MADIVLLDECRAKPEPRAVPTTLEHRELLLRWRELGDDLSVAELRYALELVRRLPAWDYALER